MKDLHIFLLVLLVLLTCLLCSCEKIDNKSDDPGPQTGWGQLTHNGHHYLTYDWGIRDAVMVHDPDCPCQKIVQPNQPIQPLHPYVQPGRPLMQQVGSRQPTTKITNQ